MTPLPPKLKKKHKVINIYILPNLLTTTNMFFGFMSLIYAIRGEYLFASYAIVAASVFDLMDGRVARLTQTTSHFGQEYDSLCDLVSFCIAPALIIYLWALQPFHRIGWLAGFVFVACGALRLARFNVQIKEEKNDFQGLPCPMSAGVVASCVLCFSYLEIHGTGSWVLLLLTFALGLTMVSTIPYPNFKNWSFKKKQPFTYLVGGVLGIILVATKPEIMLFILFSTYFLLGIFMYLFTITYQKLKERGAK